MRIVVTSASGANGDGYGALLCFSADGERAGPFSQDRQITDPRGLSLSPAVDPVCVTAAMSGCSRSARTGRSFWTGAVPVALIQAGDIRAGRPLLHRAAAAPDDPAPAT